MAAIKVSELKKIIAQTYGINTRHADYHYNKDTDTNEFEIPMKDVETDGLPPPLSTAVFRSIRTLAATYDYEFCCVHTIPNVDAAPLTEEDEKVLQEIKPLAAITNVRIVDRCIYLPRRIRNVKRTDPRLLTTLFPEDVVTKFETDSGAKVSYTTRVRKLYGALRDEHTPEQTALLLDLQECLQVPLDYCCFALTAGKKLVLNVPMIKAKTDQGSEADGDEDDIIYPPAFDTYLRVLYEQGVRVVPLPDDHDMREESDIDDDEAMAAQEMADFVVDDELLTSGDDVREQDESDEEDDDSNHVDLASMTKAQRVAFLHDEAAREMAELNDGLTATYMPTRPERGAKRRAVELIQSVVKRFCYEDDCDESDECSADDSASESSEFIPDDDDLAEDEETEDEFADDDDNDDDNHSTADADDHTV